MQLGHFDVNNAFEIIWDRVAKKIIHVWEFSFLEGLGCLSLYWKWSQRVRGGARPLNNKSDICGHLSKGKDIDGIAIGKIAIRILQWGILHQGILPHFQYLESLADMHPTVFCLENLLTSCALVQFHKAHQHWINRLAVSVFRYRRYIKAYLLILL